MTSGDSAGGAGASEVVATPRMTTEGPAPNRTTATARPTAVELSQDSDDLLTNRRGLAAVPRQEAAAAPAPADEAGIPFSAPPFDGGAPAATPFPPEADGIAPEAESVDRLVAKSFGAERSPESGVSVPMREAPVAVESPAVETAPVEAPLAADAPATSTEPGIAALGATDAAASSDLPVESFAPTLASTEPHVAPEPAAADAGVSTAISTEGVSTAEPPLAAAHTDAAGQRPEPIDTVTDAAATASSGDAVLEEPLEDSPTEPEYDPFAALPIPEDVEQAAAASYFVAWLPDEPEMAEETRSAASAAEASVAAEPSDLFAGKASGPSAEPVPTMGVPLLTALGLTDEAGGRHTNGHAATNGTAPDPAAATLATLLHEQETREVPTAMEAASDQTAESSSGSTPSAEVASSPSPSVEATSALIAELLAPSAPAAATAVVDAPLSVVALPTGNEAADAVIELPRVDAVSSEAEPIAVASPPAEPPAEPPAPPSSSSPPPPPASPLPEEEEEEGATMTIIEHLEELRKRITVSAIGIVVCAVFSWFFVPHFVNLLESDVRSLGFKFVNLSPLGPLGLNIKLAFLGGLIVSSPILFYEIWAFVAPGLTRKERRYALPFSLIGGALFALGAATAIVIIPLALRFLVSFYPVFDLENMLSINDYIMFIALIAVIFGITFELPIFMVGFSLLGVVNSRFFIQKFKIALFIMYGVAMVITPGADFVSPLVLGTFLVALYWLGVVLIRFIGK